MVGLDPWSLNFVTTWRKQYLFKVIIHLSKFCSTSRAAITRSLSDITGTIIRAMNKTIETLGFSGYRVQRFNSRFDLCAPDRTDEPKTAALCNPRTRQEIGVYSSPVKKWQRYMWMRPRCTQPVSTGYSTMLAKAQTEFWLKKQIRKTAVGINQPWHSQEPGPSYTLVPNSLVWKPALSRAVSIIHCNISS